MGNPIINLSVLSQTGKTNITPYTGAFVVDNIGDIIPSGSGSEVTYRGPQVAPRIYVVAESPSDIVALASSSTPSQDLESITAAITAHAGGGQASGVALTATINNITTCATAGDSVVLPEAVAGLVVIVQNYGAAAADVFPASGETINSGSADAAVSLPVGGRITFIASTTNNWTTEKALTLFTDIVGAKEVDHVISVTTTTTAATAGGAITITSGKAGTSGTGGAAALNGGIGGTTGTGGAVNITSGAGGTTSGDSGAVNVKSGNETSTDLSGAVTIASGTTASATSGAVTVATGANATSGDSGVLTLASGASSTSGNTGTATLKSGIATSGTSGIVTVTSGTGTTASGKTSVTTGSATTTSGLVEIITGAATTTTGAINLTTGTATTTSGAISIVTGPAVTAGNINITPGTASSTTVAPLTIISKGIVKKPLTSSVASGATITAKELLGGLITATGATGNWTLPTAAQITTAIGATPAGTYFEFIFNAAAMTGTNTATLVVGTNMTVMSAPPITGGGTLTVTQDTQVIGKFGIFYDTATTCKIARLA